MDFTLKKYKELLKELKNCGYSFYTLLDYFERSGELDDKFVILKHDVDRLPSNSVLTARIEHEHNIRGTYYFRIVPQSFHEQKIYEIKNLGHEIGYHYEDLALAKGNYDMAMAGFEKNLALLRKLYPVQTIAMHGSPLSKYDNRLLWNKYNYRNFDIVAEPTLDVDYSKIFYLTDTGRRWDGEKMSIRDKIQTKTNRSFHLTNDIIRALKENTFPEQVIFNVHPQRWNDHLFLWFDELIRQTVKNQIKRLINRI